MKVEEDKAEEVEMTIAETARERRREVTGKTLYKCVSLADLFGHSRSKNSTTRNKGFELQKLQQQPQSSKIEIIDESNNSSSSAVSALNVNENNGGSELPSNSENEADSSRNVVDESGSDETNKKKNSGEINKKTHRKFGGFGLVSKKKFSKSKSFEYLLVVDKDKNNGNASDGNVSDSNVSDVNVSDNSISNAIAPSSTLLATSVSSSNLSQMSADDAISTHSEPTFLQSARASVASVANFCGNVQSCKAGFYLVYSRANNGSLYVLRSEKLPDFHNSNPPQYLIAYIEPENVDLLPKYKFNTSASKTVLLTDLHSMPKVSPHKSPIGKSYLEKCSRFFKNVNDYNGKFLFFKQPKEVFLPPLQPVAFYPTYGKNGKIVCFAPDVIYYQVRIDKFAVLFQSTELPVKEISHNAFLELVEKNGGFIISFEIAHHREVFKIVG